MSKSLLTKLFSQIKNEWAAGLTVALISFPLSLAIAIAAGASPTTGLITAFWAGLLGAGFMKTKKLIVGVAASVITLQFQFIQNHQDIIGPETSSYIALLSICSGLFLLLIRYLNLQQYIRYVPASIVTGFASGIGLVIILGQFPNIFGISILNNIIFSSFNWIYLVTFTVAIAFMFLTEKIAIKVPSTVVISILGILGGYFLYSNQITELPLLIQQFPNLEPSIIQISNFFSLRFSTALILDLLFTSALIALVIVLESLITARYLHENIAEPVYPKNDILGLGIINIVLGLVGGMPALALISRTSANIQAGAKSRVSVFLYAIFLLIISTLLIPVIKYYPYTIIGAILVRVALPLINIKEFKHIWNTSKSNFIVAVVVAVLVVLTNASIAVLVGSTLALFVIIRNLSETNFYLEISKGEQKIFSYYGEEIPEKTPEGDLAIYSIDGIIAYFNSEIHSERLLKITTPKVVVDTMHLFLMDYEGAKNLNQVIETMQKRGQKIEFIKTHANVKKAMLEHQAMRTTFDV